MSGKQLTNYLL